MGAIRMYRELNRDITYRNGEKKDITRLKGRNYVHLKSFVDAFRQVEQSHA